MRRFAPYAKLGVWGQTQWSKVVLVDVDVVFAANVDEMGAMPAGMPAGIPSHLRRATRWTPLAAPTAAALPPRASTQASW